jgi:hypothetical protein
MTIQEKVLIIFAGSTHFHHFLVFFAQIFLCYLVWFQDELGLKVVCWFTRILLRVSYHLPFGGETVFFCLSPTEEWVTFLFPYQPSKGCESRTLTYETSFFIFKLPIILSPTALLFNKSVLSALFRGYLTFFSTENYASIFLLFFMGRKAH